MTQLQGKEGVKQLLTQLRRKSNSSSSNIVYDTVPPLRFVNLKIIQTFILPAYLKDFIIKKRKETKFEKIMYHSFNLNTIVFTESLH
jgi:hypothetical protein